MAEAFDGFEVAEFVARFKGVVNLDPGTASDVSLGDLVFFIGVGKLGEAHHKETSGGDVRRSDVITIAEAQILTGQSREDAMQLLERIGVPIDEPPQKISALPREIITEDLEEPAETRILTRRIEPGVEVQEEEEEGDRSTSITTIGSVRNPDYKGKDEKLKKFLEGAN